MVSDGPSSSCPRHGRSVRWGETRTNSPVNGLKRRCGRENMSWSGQEACQSPASKLRMARLCRCRRLLLVGDALAWVERSRNQRILWGGIRRAVRPGSGLSPAQDSLQRHRDHDYAAVDELRPVGCPARRDNTWVDDGDDERGNECPEDAARSTEDRSPTQENGGEGVQEVTFAEGRPEEENPF